MYRDNYRRALIPIAIVVLLAVAAATSGCLWAPDLAMVRKDIERQLPGASFEKEIELTLGPISLTFARLITRVVPDAREASGYLRDVSRIELAVYNAERVPPARDVKMPERLKEMTSGEDWEMAVKIRDNDELVWVFYRMEDEAVRELYVVSLDDDELVMVRAEGRLERLVARALRETGTVKDVTSDETGDPHGLVRRPKM
jgi:hypothetical protein